VKYSWQQVRQQLDREEQARKSSGAPHRMSGQPVPQEALRGSVFSDPQYVRFSWGLMYSPIDGPQISYPWAEVQQVLDRSKALVKAPGRQMTSGAPVPDAELRGTEFDRPEYQRRSWGLVYIPYDAPEVKYSWAEVNERIEMARLNGRMTQSVASGR
jgi:hypothetical protein